MKRKQFLIACLDEEDKIYEMKEYFLLLVSFFFPRGSFKLYKEKSVISNGTMSFHFMTPNQMNYLDEHIKFNDVVGSSKFIEFASFDSKHAYKYFKSKVGKVGPDGLLKKLAKSRKQSGR